MWKKQDNGSKQWPAMREALNRSRHPLVTALMPVSYPATWLPEALSSVASQTFQDFELICVVNGPDLDLETRLIQQIGGKVIRASLALGAGPARNLGISASTSPLIALIDADDIWPPTHLEDHVMTMRQRQEVIAAGAPADNIDAQGRFQGRRRVRYGALNRALVFRNQLVNSSVVFRRTALKRVGSYSGWISVGEDYDLWLRFAQIGEVVNVPQEAIGYRLHEEQTSRRGHEARSELLNARLTLARQLGIPRPLVSMFDAAREVSHTAKSLASYRRTKRALNAP